VPEVRAEEVMSLYMLSMKQEMVKVLEEVV
jgi:hypothetical protein